MIISAKVPTRTPPPLPPGTELGSKYRILKKGASIHYGNAYLVENSAADGPKKLLLRVLPAEAAPVFEQLEERIGAAAALSYRHLSSLVDHGVTGGEPFFAHQVFGGSSLTASLQRKRKSSAAFLPRTTLSLITPICQALDHAHNTIVHGALTPDSITVSPTGRTVLNDFGFGFVADAAMHASGIRFQSPFSAPEVLLDPSNASIASDVYSLGMIIVAMLTTIPLDRVVRDQLSQFLEETPHSLSELLGNALSPDPDLRPQSAGDFLARLSDGIEDLRDRIIQLSMEETASPGPAAPNRGGAAVGVGGFSRKTSLSGLLAAAELPPAPAKTDPAQWLVHKGGLDYGPYSAEQIREQLLQDEIDEHTEMRNLHTARRGFLVEFEEFGDFVADYLPVREERRRRDAERKADVQRKVKRAGATGIITAIVGVLGLIGLYLYYAEYVRPQPEEIPLDSAFAQVRSNLAPPNMGYVGIAADPDLIASLLSPEEPEPPPARRRRRRTERNSDTGTGAVQDEGDPLDRGTIDFTASGSSARLTQADINDTIRAEARRIHRCFAAERSANSNFANIGTITIQFTVRPSGNPVGVGVSPGSYTDALGSCVVRVFRSMEFPEHGGLALPVTFPIEIR